MVVVGSAGALLIVADPKAPAPLPEFEGGNPEVGCIGGRSARLLPSGTGGRFAYKITEAGHA